MPTKLITLTGGGPWGFTLTGGKDFGSHLRVSKVRGEKGGESEGWIWGGRGEEAGRRGGGEGMRSGKLAAGEGEERKGTGGVEGRM